MDGTSEGWCGTSPALRVTSLLRRGCSARPRGSRPGSRFAGDHRRRGAAGCEQPDSRFAGPEAAARRARQGGPDGARALRGRGDEDHAQLLLDLRHARDIRARPLAAHGQHPARAVLKPYRPRAALSHCHRGLAGMGLSLRKAAPLARVSGRHVDWTETAQTPHGARHAFRAVRCERC